MSYLYWYTLSAPTIFVLVWGHDLLRSISRCQAQGGRLGQQNQRLQSLRRRRCGGSDHGCHGSHGSHGFNLKQQIKAMQKAMQKAGLLKFFFDPWHPWFWVNTQHCWWTRLRLDVSGEGCKIPPDCARWSLPKYPVGNSDTHCQRDRIASEFYHHFIICLFLLLACHLSHLSCVPTLDTG